MEVTHLSSELKEKLGVADMPMGMPMMGGGGGGGGGAAASTAPAAPVTAAAPVVEKTEFVR